MTTQTPNSESCHNLPQHMQLRVILGRADDLKADVLFQMSVPTSAETPLALEGFLTGPTSTRASTLPVHQKIRIHSQRVVDEGTEILGHSILTEPAFWTPNVPMLYFVKCRITSSGKELALLSQTTGLRRLGIRNHSLWLDGHRFVLRGVTCSNRDYSSAEQQPAAPEDHRTADVLDLPAEVFSETDSLELEIDENLKTADEIGRPIIIRLHPKSRPSAIPSVICRLASHPSVFLTVIPNTLLPEAPTFSAYKGTMLFATEMHAKFAPPELPNGIDLAIVRLSQSVPDSSWKTPPPYPVIAWQTGVPSQRQECDRLQALLANWRTAPKSPPSSWDWAGYLVGDETIPHQA
ncbi:MAG: hypothetical protein MUP93_04270 [Pirellulales bacterium]|nr:hypothetical protein [Pirellulales bacterium]